MPRVEVLRLGHRLVRDDRVTTHVGLAARAFGADKIYLFDVDPKIKHTIDEVTSKWGGKFQVEFTEDWKGIIRRWKRNDGLVVHLTMYGLRLDDIIREIQRSDRDLLVIISAGKAPGEAFNLSDYNLAIGNQPHSEVSALAVFLDRYFGREELNRPFPGSRQQIIPSERGKRLEMTG